jgi:hypothetical protein
MLAVALALSDQVPQVRHRHVEPCKAISVSFRCWPLRSQLEQTSRTIYFGYLGQLVAPHHPHQREKSKGVKNAKISKDEIRCTYNHERLE